jgi:hypothetical protein
VLQVMDVSMQPRSLVLHPHWTDPISREEILARHEKFRKVGWFPLNYKPKTKRVISCAKRLRYGYVSCCSHIHRRSVAVQRPEQVDRGDLDPTQR